MHAPDPALMRALHVSPSLLDLKYPSASEARKSNSDLGESAASVYRWLLETCISSTALLYGTRQRPYSLIVKASDRAMNSNMDMHILAGYLYLRVGGVGGILRIGSSFELPYEYVPAPSYRRLCVDRTSKFATHRMSAVEFFSIQAFYSKPFDLITIEGVLNSVDLLRIIDLALAWLSADGAILFNGARPHYEVETEYPKDPEVVYWLGDVWRAILQLRSRTDVDVVIGDFDW